MKKLAILFLLLFMAVLPLVSQAQAGRPCTVPDGSGLCNAIPGATTVQGLIQLLFTRIGLVIATLAMFMLIYSGLRMILAQGDSDTLTVAKNTFYYSIVGFITVIVAYVAVSAIQYMLGVRNEDPTARTDFFFNPLVQNDLWYFIETTVLDLLMLIGTVAILYMIINGFRYLTAAGNDEQLKKAKNGITWSIIGIVVVLLSYTVIQVVIRTIR